MQNLQGIDLRDVQFKDLMATGIEQLRAQGLVLQVLRFCPSASFAESNIPIVSGKIIINIHIIFIVIKYILIILVSNLSLKR